MNRLPVILAITGASGAPYGVRLLEVLAMHHLPTWLMISSHGWRLLTEECGIKDDRELKRATGGEWTSVRVFDDKDRGAEPASGSAKTAGMVICPCSMGTVAAIAHGTSRSLIERAADVVLKERRRLVQVPRETPLSLVHLRNLTLATEAGALVLPAAPGVYHKPAQVRDLVDFVVQRVLDHLEIDVRLVKRWGGGGRGPRRHQRHARALAPGGLRHLQGGRPHPAWSGGGEVGDAERFRGARARDRSGRAH